MHEKDIQFVEESFKKYYFDHFDLIHVPEKPEQREFGYQKFTGGMNRHISIKDDKELHLFLGITYRLMFTVQTHVIHFQIYQCLKKTGKELI